jgi:hypothetical protein
VLLALLKKITFDGHTQCNYGEYSLACSKKIMVSTQIILIENLDLCLNEHNLTCKDITIYKSRSSNINSPLIHLMRV